MGLLDDAIREHLELRRLHGADLSEVISKEHEALGRATTRGERAPFESDATFTTESSMTREDRKSVSREQPAGDSGDQHLSQETVELDMRALMEEEEDSGVQVGHATPDALAMMTSAAPARALR
jgi:hypothetical protein